MKTYCKHMSWLMVTASMLLTGCTELMTPGQYFKETKSVDVTAAYQLTDRQAVEQIDLANLLYRYTPESGEVDCPDKQANQDEQARLNQALQHFNRQMLKPTVSPQTRKALRNALQEQLLVASTQRCNAYKSNLQRAFSRTNFGLGTLTTVAGTVGAIVNSAAAASAWAGVAAISSGTRAEFNQDFMSNLAAYVIVDGIDKRRRAIYEQIQLQGQAKEYEIYPVEAAIRDALYFHGQCSVIAGFQEASDSIKTAENPGINTAISMMAKVRAANLMMTSNSPETLLETAKKLNTPVVMQGGSLLPDPKSSTRSTDVASAIGTFSALNQVINQTRESLKKKADNTTTPKLDLAKLGLTKLDQINTGLSTDMQTACIKKETDFYLQEQTLNAAMAAGQSAEMQAVSQSTLKMVEMQRAQISTVLTALVDLYRLDVDKYIANLNRQFDAVKGDKKPDDNKLKAFKKALNTLPRLNGDHLKVLEKSCQ